MRKNTAFLMVCFSVFFHSCCWSIKGKNLGNNFRLSEYDNVDRRIPSSEERCSGSGIEIVPMTVTAYANDWKWIVAKSRTSRFEAVYQYWIINKDFKVDVATKGDSINNLIKTYVSGPLDATSFVQVVKSNSIDLTLKKIGSEGGG